MGRDRAFTAIVTERLRLRRFEAADVAVFFAYRADPGVVRFQSWGDYTLQEAQRFVLEMAGEDPGEPGESFQFAIARLADNRLVGDCMLALGTEEAPTAEIGYTLAPEHQGFGYATEALTALIAYAFDRHNVAAARAVADGRNAPSIRVADRLGMRLVATAQTTFKGERCDEQTYELTRGDWEART